jgi:hypothetical protein
MSNIDGINKNLPAAHMKKNVKTGTSPENRNKTGHKETDGASVLNVNKLLIEMHFKVQVESKYNFETQSGLHYSLETPEIDLSQFSFNGRPITALTQNEAAELIDEGGYFSIENTAQRLFDFAVKMAGDDPERLNVTRDAVLKGFKDAEALFGGALPEISYKTIDMALGMIDDKIRELGGSVNDIKA